MVMLDGEARRGDIRCDRRAGRWNYDSHAFRCDNMICVYWLRFTQGSSTAIALRGLPGAGIFTAAAGKASGIVGAIAPRGGGDSDAALSCKDRRCIGCISHIRFSSGVASCFRLTRCTTGFFRR